MAQQFCVHDGFMDTNLSADVSLATSRGAYRHHSREFKRSVVEESLRPGAASVARIARHHGVNANQVFKWRRAYRDGCFEVSVQTTTSYEFCRSHVIFLRDDSSARRYQDDEIDFRTDQRQQTEPAQRQRVAHVSACIFA